MVDITKIIKGLGEATALIERKVPERYIGYSKQACIDACELLKEQQPRILRLPEALGVYDPIVAEFKNPNGKTFIKWVDAVISQDLKSVDITDLYCNEPEGRKLSFSFNLYNTMFRFWSVKPTEKQRKEEPWNGDFRYL